jgi:hypothetical protein
MRCDVLTKFDKVLKERVMRKIMIAGLTVAALGFAAISGASAAPVNGGALGALASTTDHATTVQYYGGYRSYGYGYGYSRYGYGYRRGY